MAALFGAIGGLALCLVRLLVFFPAAVILAPRFAFVMAGEAVLISVLSGSLAGVAYALVDTRYARRTAVTRWGAGVFCVSAFIAGVLGLLAVLPGPFPPLPSRAPVFLAFVGVYSMIMGWVVGQDLFAPTDALERYYLTPGQVARLSAEQQIALRSADAGNTTTRGAAV